MRLEKVISELKKVFKQKNFTMILACVLICIFILISVSVFKPGDIKKTSEHNLSNDQQIQEIQIKDQYEKEQTEKLTSILSQIDGVGDVSVMMTFEGGEEKVPAYNSDNKKSVTEEEDNSGGKRRNEQKNEGENIVMSNEGGENRPFVIQVYKPKVISVIVTAAGANDSKVKYNIEKAVSDLYDIPISKVNVYPKSS